MSGDLWRLTPEASRHWRCWADEVVAYCGPTASTHLLTDDLAAVFMALAEAGGGLDEAALQQALFDAPPAAEQCRHLRDILDSLRQSGLAECRAP